MAVEIRQKAMLAERLRRQGFVGGVKTKADYRMLFRRLQPVAPVHFSYPGSPPRLVHRVGFDDGTEADRLRAGRAIVKGRFLGGRIGYVWAGDLGLYATAFRRPLDRMSGAQEAVWEIVRETGGVTPRQIKEETRLRDAPLLNKEIMPALHRLQSAFLVYEDQVDSDWEREWYDFASEWPEVDLDTPWETAAARVLCTFLEGHVFATLEQMKDWSRFAARDLKRLVAEMEKAGTLIPAAVAGIGEGWVRAEDVEIRPDGALPSVFMLHKADGLALSHATELKRRFGAHEVLQYLLIDGAFKGAVLGHWRIGPHDVEDVLVELPSGERQARRGEILEAVSFGYRPPQSRVLRYDGEEVVAMP